MQDRKMAGFGFWLAWLALIAVYVIVRINQIDIPLDRDEGIFGYAGQQIIDGGIPYRDVFDHKPPVVFYLNAIALLLFAPTARGIHLFLHFYNFLTLIAVYFVARHSTGSKETGLWAAFAYGVFTSIPAIQGFTASTEMFMLLPIALSLLFSVLGTRKSSLLLIGASGAMGALACWTKQTAVFSVAFVAAYAVAERIVRNRGVGRKWWDGVAAVVAVWGGGACGVSAAIVAYFYSNSLLDELVYWSFTHSLLYSSAAPSSIKAMMVTAALKNIFLSNILLFAAATGGCLWSLREGGRNGVYFLLFLAFSVIGTIPGYAYAHYFAQLAPATALAAGYGLAFLVGKTGSGTPRAVAAILLALLVVGGPVVTNADFYYRAGPLAASRVMFPGNPFPESLEIADYLTARTTPADSIFIVGAEPQIFLYTRRKSASPFAQIYPLTSAYPRHREFQMKTLADIARHNPKYILYVDISTSMLYDGKVDVAFETRICDYINEKYRLDAIMLVPGGRGEMILNPPTMPEAIMDRPKIAIYRRKE